MGSRFSHIFMLVSDLGAQRHLFVDALGLRVLAQESGYLRLGGEYGFHIGTEEGHPGPSNTVEIVIRVDDVDAMYQRLVDAVVDVEGPPQDQEWGARHLWF